jgi:hypothetical protein
VNFNGCETTRALHGDDNKEFGRNLLSPRRRLCRCKTVKLREGEYFTEIGGFIGDNGLETQVDGPGSRIIRQLSLRTNSDELYVFGCKKLSITKVPLNIGDDLTRFQPFEYTVPKGSEIRSFFGYSADSGLRGIGVRYTIDNLHPGLAPQTSTYVV